MATREIISLAPQDIKRIARTVFRLRQMRGSHSFEGMLNDAEELGTVAADAIVGLVQTGSPALLVARWEEALNDFGLKYLRSFDSGGRELDAAAGYIGIAISPILQDKWQSPVRRLLQANNLTTLSPADFLNPELGVFSPLATDYLLYAVIHQYLTSTVSSSVFQLKPVYVAREGRTPHREVIFPKTTSGNRVFEECSRIIPLLDIVGFYTRPSLIHTIARVYPDKVHIAPDNTW